jgi:hypothetical protein
LIQIKSACAVFLKTRPKFDPAQCAKIANKIPFQKTRDGSELQPIILHAEESMLRKDQNDLVTQIGPAMPMGQLFRSYLIPALLAEELRTTTVRPYGSSGCPNGSLRSATAKAVTASSMNFARTAAPRCGSDATRNAACGAHIMARNSTSPGNAWRCRRSRRKAALPNASS